MKWSLFARFVLVFALVVLFVATVAPAALAGSWVGQSPTPTPPADPSTFLLWTVAQLAQWLTVFGIGAAVNYVLGFFPSVPVNVRNFITGLCVAVLTAAVVYIAAQLSPAQLNMTLLQVATAVVGLLVSFAGSLFGLVKGKQARAAAVASRLLDA